MELGRPHLVTFTENAALPAVTRILHQNSNESLDATLPPRQRYLFYFLLEGSFHAAMNEGIWTKVAPGTFLICFPGQSMKLRSERGMRRVLYHCHCNFPNAIEKEIGHGDAALLAAIDARAGSVGKSLCLVNGIGFHDPSPLAESFSRILCHQQSGQIGSELAAAGIFLEMLQMVSRATLRALLSRSAPVSGRRGQIKISRAVEFIERNITIPISLFDVAQHLETNQEHLARLFKKATGRTVGDYILRRKISIAQERLLGSRQSIKEVAASVGFTDPLYFSRQFKKLEGESPLAFIEKHAI